MSPCERRVRSPSWGAGRPDLATAESMRAQRLVRRDPGLLAGTEWDLRAAELLAVHAHSAAGKPREALAVLERQADGGSGSDDIDRFVETGLLRMVLLGQLGEGVAAVDVGDALVRGIAGQAVDRRMRCLVLNSQASSLNIAGRAEEGLSLASEALAIALETGDPGDLVESRSNVGLALSLLGQEVPAHEELTSAWRMARETGALLADWGSGEIAAARAYALVNIADTLGELGEHGAVVEAAVLLDRDLCREVMTRECRLMVAVAARALYRLGRWSEAAAGIHRSLRGAEPQNIGLPLGHARTPAHGSWSLPPGCGGCRAGSPCHRTAQGRMERAGARRSGCRACPVGGATRRRARRGRGGAAGGRPAAGAAGPGAGAARDPPRGRVDRGARKAPCRVRWRPRSRGALAAAAADPPRAADALVPAHALSLPLPARTLAWRIERAAEGFGPDLGGARRPSREADQQGQGAGDSGGPQRESRPPPMPTRLGEHACWRRGPVHARPPSPSMLSMTTRYSNMTACEGAEAGRINRPLPTRPGPRRSAACPRRPSCRHRAGHRSSDPSTRPARLPLPRTSARSRR